MLHRPHSANGAYWERGGQPRARKRELISIDTFRTQISFTAARAHARLRLSRLELIGHSGRVARRRGQATNVLLRQSLWDRTSAAALDLEGGGRQRDGHASGL